MAGKIDQGFCLNYWRLSYRRRLIRDLWMLPVAGTLLALFHWWFFRPSNLAGYWPVLLVIAVGVASAIYNYRQWKFESPSKSIA